MVYFLSNECLSVIEPNVYFFLLLTLSIKVLWATVYQLNSIHLDGFSWEAQGKTTQQFAFTFHLLISSIFIFVQSEHLDDSLCVPSIREVSVSLLTVSIIIYSQTFPIFGASTKLESVNFIYVSSWLRDCCFGQCPSSHVPAILETIVPCNIIPTWLLHAFSQRNLSSCDIVSAMKSVSFVMFNSYSMWVGARIEILLDQIYLTILLNVCKRMD